MALAYRADMTKNWTVLWDLDL